ncbi:MDR family NADP-dependent oxidoreductase [Streptomyces sp. 796.1]|uniref:MDR family NADP-dependent oxidoreductase n=1 Tax=Streptomyces sp. 796.1 TaxID=3163029 RepID=UPI0039C947D9
MSPVTTAGRPVDVPATHREVRLVERPGAELRTEHFALRTAPVPAPGPGQLLVRNRYMAVVAVMRTLMTDADLPMPAYEVDAPLWGPAIGEVVAVGDDAAGAGAGASAGAGVAVGDLVEHHASWREYAAVDAGSVRALDLDALPDPAAHLSQALTAWAGVVRGGEVRPGDTVFVSGAAGGVGSMAGQIARLHGAARVIGSTSSQRKADYLTGELGYDAAVLRGAGPIEEQLRRLAPDGLDVVFDNVGGEQLQAALKVANRKARFAIIGALSGQLGPAGSTALVEIDTLQLLARSIELRGLTLLDHLDSVPQWTREIGAAMAAGRLTFPHTRFTGLDQAPGALVGLIAGQHVGAVVVEL